MHGRRETRSGPESVTGTELGLRLVAAPAPEAHDLLTSVGRRPWLVLCTCGWRRECLSAWAAESAAKVHQRLGSNHQHAHRFDQARALTPVRDPASSWSLPGLVRVLEQIEPPARVAVRPSTPALELHPPVVPGRNSEDRGAEGEAHYEQEGHHPDGQLQGRRDRHRLILAPTRRQDRSSHQATSRSGWASWPPRVRGASTIACFPPPKGRPPRAGHAFFMLGATRRTHPPV